MTIDNTHQTVHLLMGLMGSETTSAEAAAMRQLLLDRGVDDTEDIGDMAWRDLMDAAIRMARK